jgi:hypothetical protein
MFVMPGSKSGRCTNYFGCKLAYRNEQITVVTKDFRCPECGSPLEPFDYGRQRFGLRFLSVGVVGVLLFAVGAIVWTLFFSAGPPVPPSNVEVTAAATPTASATPAPAETPVARVEPTPSPVPVATPQIPDVKTVREEARERIFRIPNVPDATRELLLQAVDRAHGVGRLFEVTFEPSSAKLTAEDVSYLRSRLQNDQIKKLLGDQSLVLYVLGFADRQGDDERNEIQTVSMGGTNIRDLNDYAKNRVVEVWATVP